MIKREYERSDQEIAKLFKTRKYLLCGYILGVLRHITAWDPHWEGDEILK